MTKDKRPCSIYAITHLASGRKYVGSSINPTGRWIEHRSDLKLGKHHCAYLQNAWNKYGKNTFEFSIIRVLEDNNSEYRAKAELEEIANANCFNSRVASLGATNFVNNQATRQKIKRGIDKRISEDENHRIWLANRGAELAAHARTPERRAIRSILTKKLWDDPEHRKSVSAALAKHWEQPGVREAHSERVKLHRGTPEARKKNSESSLSRSSELSAIMTKTNKKRWADPEAKKRQSEKLKAAWQRRKETS